MSQTADDFLGESPQADEFLDAPVNKPYIDTASGMVQTPYGPISGSSAQDIGPGAREGAEKFWAGIKQLGAAISDSAENFWKPQGKMNPQTGAVEGALQNWDKRQKAVTSAENERATQQEAIDKSHGVNIDDRDALAGALQVVPWLASGNIIPGAVESGYLGNLTKQAALGVVQQAATFQPKPSGFIPIAIGTAAQILLPAATSAVAAGKNAIARKITNALAEGNTEQAFQAAKSVLGDNWANTITLAQRTGIPWLTTMERGSYNSQLVKTYANQTDQTISQVAQALRQEIPVGQGLDGAFMSARNSASNALDKLVATRNSLWENGMAKFKNDTKDLGDMPLPTFGAKLQELQADAANAAKNPGKYNISAGAEAALADFTRTVHPPVDPATVKADAQLQQLINSTSRPETKAALAKQMSNNGEPPVAKAPLSFASDYLTGIRKMQQDADPKVQAIAKQLRDSFETDLTNAQQSITDPKGAKALLDLKEMRAEYGRQAHGEEIVRNSATYTMLGVGQGIDQKIPPSTEDMWNGFAKMLPARQDSVVTWMGENNPSALLHMKQKSVNDAIAGAGTLNPARDSQQNLNQLVNGLFDKEQGFVPRNPGLWTAEENQKLADIKKGLSVIANNRMTQGNAGTPIQLHDITTQIASQSPIFITRALTRVFEAGFGADIFTNPKIIDQLTKIGKLSGSAQVTARVVLANTLSDIYGKPVARPDLGK